MVTFTMLVKMKPRNVIDPVTLNSHKRIAMAAGMVERKAKQICSKGGGKGTPGDENSYYYGRPLNRWVKKSKPGSPPNLQTGSLRNSIAFEFISFLTAVVGPSISYGRHLEFGTRKMGARPFMRPAFLAVKILDLFRKLLT